MEKNNPLPKHVIARISFDEKMIATSPQWPRSSVGKLKKQNSEELYLTDYAHTSKTIEIDTAGIQNIEVTWVEGNANIRLPIEMWNDIKDKTNPIDPQTNPMNRYTIINGQYTAYGTDGSVIFSAKFPVDTIPAVDTTFLTKGKINSNFKIVAVNDINAKPVAEIVRNYQRKGILCKALGENYILLEQNIQSPQSSVRTKAVINVRTSLIERFASYNTEGNLSSVVLLSYQEVNGYYYPTTVMDFTMGKLYDGSWGILTKTIQSRTNLKIVTR